MSDRNQIAYLQELAISHFNDGNLDAAIAAWEQVLALDPLNSEARQGVTVAEMKKGGSSGPSEGPLGGGGESSYDADATMMFAPPDAGSPFGAPAGAGSAAPPPAGGFDGDSTMMLGGNATPFGGPATPGGFQPSAPGPFDASPVGGFNPQAAPRAPAAPAGGFDADSTMMFNPAAPVAPWGTPAPAAPAAPSAGGFDADSTMMFNPAAASPAPPPRAPAGGFDADSTMMFNPAAAPPAPPPRAAAGGFDADSTMMFNPSLAPPPSPPMAPVAPPLAPPPPAIAELDSDSTMMFSAPAAPAPGGVAPAAPAWGAAPALPAASAPASDWLSSPLPSRDADMTAMSPDSGFDLPPSTAAPRFDLAPPAPVTPAAPGNRTLEDFVMPTDGLQMAGSAPSMPSLDLPKSPPSSSGFSFELPPSPSAGGGGFAMPDLPSVGLSTPPPAFLPPPPPAAPVMTPKKKAGQFGEVEAGEADALAVPTIGLDTHGAPAEGPAPGSAEAREREEQLKRDYEQQFGKSTAPLPRPAAPTRPAQKSKVPLFILLALVGFLGLAYVVVKYVIPKDKHEIVVVPPPPEPLAVDVAKEKMIKLGQEASDLLRQGKLADAKAKIVEAGEIGRAAGVEMLPELDETGSAVDKELAYKAAFERAIRSFCIEDYSKANLAFVDLERVRPSNPEPGKYIGRIFYNLGVEKLQVKEPWDAVYYFESVLARDASDAQAKELLAFAQAYEPGDALGYKYTQKADSLPYRMAGCR